MQHKHKEPAREESSCKASGAIQLAGPLITDLEGADERKSPSQQLEMGVLAPPRERQHAVCQLSLPVPAGPQWLNSRPPLMNLVLKVTLLDTSI